MSQTLLIFALLCVFCTTEILADKCLKDIKEGHHYNAIYLKRIELDIPSDVVVTWQAARGTTDLSIWTTDDVTITSDDVTDDVITIKAGGGKNAASDLTSRVGLGLLLVTCGIAHLAAEGQRKWTALFILVLASLFAFGQSQNTTICKPSSPTIHIQIPTKYLETLCISGECRDLLCQLSQNSIYSHVPSNNRILFLDDACNIRKPEFWDEWLIHFFGSNETETFLGDSDNDGLVNILEYYGPDALKDDFVVVETVVDNGNRTKRNAEVTKVMQEVKDRVRRQAPGLTLADILMRGTDPTNPDSDGDLITDGRESFFGTDPRTAEPADGDEDGDRLNTLDEQIHNTDPRDPDSDGDGVPDGDEAEGGSDPTDPRDGGQPSECEQAAEIKITVGDHSSSHSERYVFILGNIRHQSPGYGLVGSGTYTYKVGTYTGTIEHRGTNRGSRGPDYDYTARVEKVGGDAKVTIGGDNSILGNHGESSFFYAAGKSITVTVEMDCEDNPDNECCGCSQHQTCSACRASRDPRCCWSVDSWTCTKRTSHTRSNGGTIDSCPGNLGPAQCPCEQCDSWYNEEMMDTSWLDNLNRELPCPCTVNVMDNELVPVQPETGPEWTQDPGCHRGGAQSLEPLTWGSNCDKWHHGATGCIRSDDSDNIGDAGQQCCYGATGGVLSYPHAGAGTPDKQKGGLSNIYDHTVADVTPFERCCIQCEQRDQKCEQYTGGVRKGDNSHCNK